MQRLGPKELVKRRVVALLPSRTAYGKAVRERLVVPNAARELFWN